MSVIGSLLYIGSHVPNFQCLKANLTIINLVFPTDTRPYQQYSHIDTVTNYPYISLPAINKTFLEMLHTYFCLLLACELIGCYVAKRLPETHSNNWLLYCYSPGFSDQFDVDKNCAPTRARLNKRWVTC